MLYQNLIRNFQFFAQTVKSKFGINMFKHPNTVRIYCRGNWHLLIPTELWASHRRNRQALQINLNITNNYLPIIHIRHKPNLIPIPDNPTLPTPNIFNLKCIPQHRVTTFRRRHRIGLLAKNRLINIKRQDTFSIKTSEQYPIPMLQQAATVWSQVTLMLQWLLRVGWRRTTLIVCWDIGFNRSFSCTGTTWTRSPLARLISTSCRLWSLLRSGLGLCSCAFYL